MDCDYNNYFFIIVTFLQFLIMSPLFILLFAYYEIYKYVIGVIIRKKYGKHFKGFLEGSDVVWALGGDDSRGVINVMAFIEEKEINEKSSRDILLSLRKRISGKLMRNTQPHPKMFYKRTEEMGYFFWTDLSDLTIEDYIRYLDIVPAKNMDKKSIESDDLRSFMSRLSNSKLPGDHSSSWEILVGRQPVYDKERSVFKYPVGFYEDIFYMSKYSQISNKSYMSFSQNQLLTDETYSGMCIFRCVLITGSHCMH